MQVHAIEKIKKYCTLLPYVSFREAERYCGPPKYNVGGSRPPCPPASYATERRTE